MSKQLRPVSETVETKTTNDFNSKNDIRVKDLKSEFNKAMDNPAIKIAGAMNPVAYVSGRIMADNAFKSLEKHESQFGKQDEAIHKSMAGTKALNINAESNVINPENKSSNSTNTKSRAEQAEAKFGDIAHKSDSINKGMEL